MEVNISKGYMKNVNVLKTSSNVEGVMNGYLLYEHKHIYNNNNMLHLYSAFLGTQSALHSNEGISSSTTSVQHPPDDVTAPIVRQNTPHTPATGGEEREMKSISEWGWLGGRDGQRTMGKFGQDTGVTPLLFSKDILGFIMTTESQDLGFTSHPKDIYIHTTVAQMAVKTGFPLNAVCCYTLPARDKKIKNIATYIEEKHH